MAAPLGGLCRLRTFADACSSSRIGPRLLACQFDMIATVLNALTVPLRGDLAESMDRGRGEPVMQRKGQRLKLVLPVRAYGTDSNGKPFTTMAHTLDVSMSGARIAGLNLPLKVGDIIGLQKGTDKARFRVIWIGTREDGTEGQVGLQCVQTGKSIWGVQFENQLDTWQSSRKADANKSSTWTKATQPERRRSQRYPCNLGAELLVEGSSLMLWGRCTDISGGGCYIETRSPLPAEAKIEVHLRTDLTPFVAESVVRASHQFLGMGMQFTKMSEQDAKVLGRILMSLANNALAEKSQPMRSATPPPRLADAQRLSNAISELRALAAASIDDAAMLASVRKDLDTLSALIMNFQRVLRERINTGTQVDCAGIIFQHNITTLTALVHEVAQSPLTLECDKLVTEELIGSLDDARRRLADSLQAVSVNETRTPFPEVIQFPAANS